VIIQSHVAARADLNVIFDDRAITAP